MNKKFTSFSYNNWSAHADNASVIFRRHMPRALWEIWTAHWERKETQSNLPGRFLWDEHNSVYIISTHFPLELIT